MAKYGPAPKPAIDRFMGLTQKTPDGHWLWTGGCTEKGYGVFKDENGVSCRAHRWSYAHFNGPILPGEVVRHRCDINNCVNPNCLLTGTQADNQQDMLTRGRLGKRRAQSRINGQRRVVRARRMPLTFEIAEKIRELYSTGNYSQYKLANMFDAQQTTISRIVRGRIFTS